jgi:hypothetical protein
MKLKGATISMRWIIAVTLGVVFFTSLITTIGAQVIGALYLGGNTSKPTNVTGAANTILGLTTLVVVILFIAKIAGKA